MKEGREPLKIYTLGRFMVKKGEKLITANRQRSRKRWHLFQLLITYRDQDIPIEKIISYLDLNESVNPQEALKSLVYYLRKDLRKKSGKSKETYILKQGGLYFFNSSADYWLDTEIFEELCNKADQLQENQVGVEEVISVYRQALALYHGDYLEEVSSASWVLPVRSHYRNLFLESVIKVCKLLKKTNQHGIILDLCEKGLRTNLLEEKFHQFSIQALIDSDRSGLARIHYTEAAAMFARNDLELPPALCKIGEVLKNKGSPDIKFSDVLAKLMTRYKRKGAFVCNLETFEIIYELEKARIERTGKDAFLVHLQITEVEENPTKDSGDTVGNLEVILKEELRKGDVVCKLDRKNILLLLTNTMSENIPKVIARIEDKFGLSKLALENRIIKCC